MQKMHSLMSWSIAGSLLLGGVASAAEEVPSITSTEPGYTLQIDAVPAGTPFLLDGRRYLRSGDMLIPADEKRGEVSIQGEFDVHKNKWTDGKVFYEFAPDVTAENRQRFVEAAQVWESVAQLTFIERNGQENYVYVQNDNRNYAIVGMVGGKQILSMNAWWSKYVIVHEIGHTLGMWHEQQRPDRDNYVTIMDDNIDPTQRYNFTTRNVTSYSDYDFMSVMHYSLGAYSINGKRTIEPKPGYEEFATIAGQKNFISGGDQFGVASHYGATEISIPDAAFKNYLLSHFDSNQDGKLDSLEAARIEQIQTPGQGQIQSLQGLQHFRYLRTLDASNENLTALPEELPSRLRSINVSHNQISELQEQWVFPPLMQNIVASHNPLDPYSCEQLQFISSDLGANNLVYSPLADGSELVCDEQSGLVLIDGKPRKDIRSKEARTYFIEVPAQIDRLNVSTSVYESMDGGEMDLFVAFNRKPTSSDYDYSSTNAGRVENVAVNNPQLGTWYVTLQPTDRSFEHVNLVASFDTLTGPTNQLEKGVSRQNLAGAQGGWQHFVIDLPEQARDFTVTIAGGSGDADLYVRYGAEATLQNYDCRPWRDGNQEACNFSAPQAGRYYVSINGYRAFEGVSLVADYRIEEPATGGELIKTNLSGFGGQWLHFEVDVPAGMSELKVELSGGNGDADLYLQYGSQPTSSQFVCRPYKYGNQESCVIATPQAGKWYVSLRGYTQFSGVNLTAVWQ